MKFTVRRGVKYAAEIKLSGIETMASDDYIAQQFEEAGFRDVTVETVRDDLRIAYGIWNGADTSADLPSQVVYCEEA